MENKYTEFKRVEDELDEIYFIVWNKVYNQAVGIIRKERMGKWMHWQLFLNEGCGCSNGCLKEITEFITSLYPKGDKNQRKLE